MASRSDAPSQRAYTTNRWPTRAMVTIFLAIGIVSSAASGVVLPLVPFGVLAGLIMVASERTKVETSSHGVKSVPPYGRAREYPWSDIESFVAQRASGGYGGWIVSMRVTGGWVGLIATRRVGFGKRSKGAVEDMAEHLNAELTRAARG
jgi:hypothetical protein